jgi:hypothetical protein
MDPQFWAVSPRPLKIEMRHHATNTRDAALRKLARINRWMIAGSVALTGVLSEVAAQAFPGKAKASTSSTAAKHGAARDGHAAPQRPTPLAPPATAPSTSEAAPETVPEASRGAEAAPESAKEPSAPQEPSAPRESAPAPAPESAPAPEPAPQQESSGPVISGGS